MANSGYGTDITNQQAGNYAYDPIGNMVSDIAGGITGIAWTVYGKIQSVAKDGSTVQYTYDASGNRISKVANGVETWYVRDATGNVMATYTKGDISINSGNLTQAEVDLYGSSRLGLLNTSVNCSNNGNGPAALGNAWDATYNRGQKLFELTNHLGNVLATITDRLVPVPDASNTFIDHNLPDVASANDYYSFGMAMPGRSFSAGSQYRYGFNGKENDGETGYQDYGARGYNPETGTFLSVDPLTSKYPMLTPYQFASNSPISGVDLDGKEYLRADESRINLIRGTVYLKLANTHAATYNQLGYANEQSSNWKKAGEGQNGEVGIDTRLGNLSFGYTQADISLDKNVGAPDINAGSELRKIDVGVENAKSTGQPDRRFKDRTISTSPRAAGLAVASIAIDAAILYANWQMGDDNDKAQSNIKTLENATYDINFALAGKIKDIQIPTDLRTTEALSDITNVVLQGTSYLKEIGDKRGSQILVLGKQIFEFAKSQRTQYLQPLIIRGPSDQIKSIPNINPTYNKDYSENKKSATARYGNPTK